MVSSSAKVRLQLFGAASVWLDGVRQHVLPDSLPACLAVYLASRREGFSREALAALFWPERDQSEALHSLRVNLHRLRLLLTTWGLEQGLQTDRQRVCLSVDTDVGAFKDALGRADWQQAVALQAEPLLATMSFRGLALLEAWAQTERQALSRAGQTALLRLAQHVAGLASESPAQRANDRRLAQAASAAAGPEQGQATWAAQRLLRLPTEDLSDLLVQALLRLAPTAGCVPEALLAYERLCRQLHDDGGQAPLPATRELAHALKTAGRLPPTQAVRPQVNVPRSIEQPPRLVGRDAERACVADLQHRVVLVAGEPGVGKTRLLEDALPGARWLSCREGLQNVPWASAIDYLADHQEGLPELGNHRQTLARLLPSLAPGEVQGPADPVTAQLRTLQALANVLHSGASAVVIDDLQWADPATLALVLHLARQPGPPLRLLYRVDEQTPAMDTLFETLEATLPLQRLVLQPLSAAALTQLLANLADTAQGPPRFSAWLHHRTGGNPVFVLQTLRALFESGRLQAHAEGWSSDLDTLTVDYAELDVPSNLAGLVKRRLSGLPEPARRVLSVVALLGSVVDTARIAALAEVSAWSAAESIALAQGAGLLQGQRFVHDLIRHSVLEATPAAVRQVLHSGVARDFGGLLPPAALAQHAWVAGDTAMAVQHTRAAAEKYGHAGLHAQAVLLLQQALARDIATHEQGQLHSQLAQLQLAAGDLQQAEVSAQAAIEAPAWPAERALALCCLATLRMQQGRMQDARTALDEAAASAPDTEAWLNARGQLAQFEGRAADVVGDFERQVALLRRQPVSVKLITTLASLGSLYSETGQDSRALAVLEEGYRLAQRLGARYAQVEVAVNLLRTLTDQQLDLQAIAVAEESLALGEYDASATLRNNLAWALRALGRLDEARAHYAALQGCSDPTLALMASAKLMEMAGEAADTEQARHIAQHLLAHMNSTEAYLAHAVAVLAVLRYGSDEQALQAQRHLRRQALDPSLSERLSAALQARGIDPALYLPEVAAQH